MHHSSWGMVGIGKLGQALLEQLKGKGQSIGIYHPDQQKSATIQSKYPFSHLLKMKDLSSLDFLILALPAQALESFLRDLEKEGVYFTQTVLVNMATALKTSTLRHTFPELQWLGLKFMGHSEDLFQYGNGLFVTEKPLANNSAMDEVRNFFSSIGHIVFDREEVVEKVNRLATYYGVKAAKELTQQLVLEGYSAEYIERALVSLAPQVVKAYATGSLGHFGQMVAKQLEQEQNAETI